MLFLPLFLMYSKYQSVQSAPSETSDDKVAMSCTESNMTATFNESALQGVITNITVHPSCNNVSYHLDVNEIKMVSIPFADCPNITQGVKQMRQTMEVAVQVSKPINDVVHRVFTYHFKLHCDFDRHLKVSQSQRLGVSHRIKSFLLSSKTNFSASLRYYKSSAFAQIAEAPLRVAASEPIYLKIEAAYANPLLKFVTQECFATPTNNQHDPVRYMFFSDRCPIDSTFQNHGATGSQNKFSIDAFAFIKVKKQVFFHCKLLVCKSNTMTPECKQECNLQKKKKRRRRTAKEDSSLNEVTVNSGAVVYQEKPACDDITCPPHSLCVDLTPAECKCLDGYVLDSLNHRCANQNLVELQGLHLDERFSDLYFDSDPRKSLHLARYFERSMMVRLSNYSKIVGVKVGGVREERVLRVTLLYSNSSTPREAYAQFLQLIFTSEEAVPGINTGVFPKLQGDFVDDDEVLYPGLLICALLGVLIIAIAIVIIRNHRNGDLGNPSSHTFSFKDTCSEDSSQ